MQAALGLGGSIHSLDIHHLDNPSVRPPPAPNIWRFTSPTSLPKAPQSFHWPSAIGLYLFVGSFVSVSMWFYNLNLKAAGFDWQVWKKATIKEVIPTNPIDCLSFQDTFDKDNPIQPVQKQNTPKLSKARPFRRLNLLAALGTLSSMYTYGNIFQLQSDLHLRQRLRRYRNGSGGLDSNRIKPAR